MQNDKVLGINQPVQTMLIAAYGPTSAQRTIWNTDPPQGKYDFIANLPQGSAQALQRAKRSPHRSCSARVRVCYRGKSGRAGRAIGTAESDHLRKLLIDVKMSKVGVGQTKLHD
jgi:hypothetical protein